MLPSAKSVQTKTRPLGSEILSADPKVYQVLWLDFNTAKSDHRQLVPPFAHPGQAGFCTGEQPMM